MEGAQKTMSMQGEKTNKKKNMIWAYKTRKKEKNK